MSVQKYETDVLQEHVDSTPILIQRLDQWREGVHVVEQYASGFYQLQHGTTQHLEKILKGVSEPPAFPSTYTDGSSKDPTSGPTELSAVFSSLETDVNALIQRSTATANNIKQTVLPPIEQVQSEIDKHYKSLKSHGLKGAKEVEKSREHTQKSVEQLGSVTSSFGARNLSPSEDPYVLHRKAEAAVAEQVSRENNQAEAALQVQQQFASLEQHVVQTVKQSLAQLAALVEGYDQLQTGTAQQIAKSFANLNMSSEWQHFITANKSQLVPTTNFLRDPKYVTFSNKNHASGQPIVQGLLNRKGTVLKQYNQSYYVHTPAGYLYQFKSAEPTIDATPELALYVPESEVNKSVKNGEYTFRVVTKDARKALGTRHKYIFKANSPREWEIWYNAIARLAGHVIADDAVNDDGADTPDTPASPTSPEEPPTSQLNAANLQSKEAESPSTSHEAAGLGAAGLGATGAAAGTGISGKDLSSGYADKELPTGAAAGTGAGLGGAGLGGAGLSSQEPSSGYLNKEVPSASATGSELPQAYAQTTADAPHSQTSASAPYAPNHSEGAFHGAQGGSVPQPAQQGKLRYQVSSQSPNLDSSEFQDASEHYGAHGAGAGLAGTGAGAAGAAGIAGASSHSHGNSIPSASQYVPGSGVGSYGEEKPHYGSYGYNSPSSGADQGFSSQGLDSQGFDAQKVASKGYDSKGVDSKGLESELKSKESQAQSGNFGSFGSGAAGAGAGAAGAAGVGAAGASGASGSGLGGQGLTSEAENVASQASHGNDYSQFAPGSGSGSAGDEFANKLNSGEIGQAESAASGQGGFGQKVSSALNSDFGNQVTSQIPGVSDVKQAASVAKDGKGGFGNIAKGQIASKIPDLFKGF